MTTAEILNEFSLVQELKGYKRPKDLAEIERSPSDDEEIDIPQGQCPVDYFIRRSLK